MNSTAAPEAAPAPARVLLRGLLSDMRSAGPRSRALRRATGPLAGAAPLTVSAFNSGA